MTRRPNALPAGRTPPKAMADGAQAGKNLLAHP